MRTIRQLSDLHKVANRARALYGSKPRRECPTHSTCPLSGAERGRRTVPPGCAPPCCLDPVATVLPSFRFDSLCPIAGDPEHPPTTVPNESNEDTRKRHLKFDHSRFSKLLSSNLQSRYHSTQECGRCLRRVVWRQLSSIPSEIALLVHS